MTSLLARQPACIKRWNTTRNGIVRSATTLWLVVVPRRTVAPRSTIPTLRYTILGGTLSLSLSLSVGGLYGIYTNYSILSQKGSETGLLFFLLLLSLLLMNG